MRLTIAYAYATDVSRTSSRGRHGSHRYTFEDEATFDVPEFGSEEAPLVVRHAAFRSGYPDDAPRALVEFRRIGDHVYEPISRADGTRLVGLDPASVAACAPSCAALAARMADTRFLGRGSRVVPDRYKADKALAEVTATVGDIALVDGAAYRRSYEPVYVVRDRYVTTAPSTEFWSEDKPWSRFRLDEAELARDCLVALGRDPGELANARARFEVVDATLLAADLTNRAIDAMARDCMETLSKGLHARPRAAVVAYVNLRSLVHAKHGGDVLARDEAHAVEAAVDVLDLGHDDRGTKAKARMALAAFARRTGASPVAGEGRNRQEADAEEAFGAGP